MATAVGSGVGCWPAPHSNAVNAPDRSLFAKGLAKGCTSAHLQAIFSAFGTVTDCQIARHRSGRSAGFAIVTFARHEEAVQAMKAVDNLLFMGRRLSVKWFSPERAMEGSSQGLDALNMQALQQMLQLSQLQPVDLMAQLAQMLDAPKLPAQNPHVAAWLDNFGLPRDSTLAPPMHHDATQQPASFNVLDLSSLSLADLPCGPMVAPSPAPGLSTHPATPTSQDVPDGAVFVTANLPDAGGLAHSRLSKWCSAPGSVAGGPTSAAPSMADDATSETASLHASDDSSIATSGNLAALSCDPSEGSSPAAPLAKVEPTVVSAPMPAPPSAAPAAAVGPVSLESPVFLGRGHTAPSRASEPGFSLTSAPAPPLPALFPGAPALAPLRTHAAGPAPAPAPVFPPHHAHHQHVGPRSAPAAVRPGAMGPFGSCGGGAPPAMQQALLQQALAEQARNNAQQQYVDALAKLAAAREQMVAAASLLGGGAMGLPPHAVAPRMAAGPSPAMGHQANGYGVPAPAVPAHGIPDLSTLLLLQNAAGMGGADLSRPFY